MFNFIYWLKKNKLSRFIRLPHIPVSDILIGFLWPTPLNCRLKTLLLRRRGATIGSNAVIDQDVRIRDPRGLSIGDDVVISHGVLMGARKLREIADYDIDEEIVEPVASLKIEEGRAFLSAIKKFLGDL